MPHLQRVVLLVKYSAKDVVATFKYYILHPEEKPTKAGWGKEYNNKEEKKEDDYKVIEAKKKVCS